VNHTSTIIFCSIMSTGFLVAIMNLFSGFVDQMLATFVVASLYVWAFWVGRYIDRIWWRRRKGIRDASTNADEEEQ